jgi:transposase-like protein
MTQEITVSDPSLDPNWARCYRYVELREMTTPRPTMDTIAKEMGVTKVTLYRWVNTWRLTGLLPAIRRLMMTEIAEDVEDSDRYLLANMFEMTRRQVDIAINGKDFNATNAYNSLQPRIQQMLEEQDSVGSIEKDYIEGFAKVISETNVFDPLAIPGQMLAPESSPEDPPEPRSLE